MIDPGSMSIGLLNGQNMTVISEHYGHSAKILGYGYCSTGPISIISGTVSSNKIGIFFVMSSWTWHSEMMTIF